jgi:predicted transcriptional regulator
MPGPLKDKKLENVLRLLQPSQPFKLGPLERRILSIVFQRGSATVREIVDQGDFPQAYTTILTTLNRLRAKGLLVRIEEGRAFRYTPHQSQSELEYKVATASIRQLLGSNLSAPLPLSYLVETISELDIRLLDELHRLIDEKRSALAKNSK